MGTSTPEVKLHINSTDAIKIPVGTIAQRPVADVESHRGYIRFNTDTTQFEGFGAGNAWSSLGGVTDVDKDTYITAEDAANVDNDQLKFYTKGDERLCIDDDGTIQIQTNSKLSIGSNMIAENDVQITKGIILNADGTEVNNPDFTVANGEYKRVLDYAPMEAQYVNIV